MKKRNREPRSEASPARAAAFDILLRVERESSYATELLHSKTVASLTKVDHSLVTELVMGVLRWRSLLDLEISKSSSQTLSRLDIEILTALRLAVYQLRWLSRIPARAAVHESVELVKRARKRSAAPFVNAVLRKINGANSKVPEFDRLQINGASVETLASSSAHPLWLVQRWVQAYGLEVATRICCQDQSVPVTAIRLRHFGAEERLQGEGIELAPGALLGSARRVLRGDVTASATFRSGWCVIQDEASQLVAALVGRGASVLDCCAAPGGKTLAIADRNTEAHITAVDLHAHRVRLLRRLLRADDSFDKAGANKIGVVAADARSLPFAANFDRVLADVPCSGTGTLSRNPEIKWRLMPQDLADLQVRQLAILKSAMAQVSRGGRVVYSTCSLEQEENENIIERALAEDSSFRVVDCGGELARLKQRGELIWDDVSALTQGSYLRTLPGVQPCDGFFAAILERI
ncbi:MAG: 16S rRNA (cytosine(967)-C(5))-methyltransferase RsmB [Candidatus Sulfotelmatobacter sp.]